MALWKLDDEGAATAVAEVKLDAERLIESAVESAPELLGIEVLIVGRQTQTASGVLDLLAIDEERRLVVIENKRDRTPRDVLAQAIDYAAWASDLTYADLTTVHSKYRAKFGHEETDIAKAYEDRFGEQLDKIEDTPRIIVVASRLDDSTERMIDFLADNFGVPINAVLFQPFEGGLIGRTWLRPDESRGKRGGSGSAANIAAREESKVFWDAWLDTGRSALPEIQLPKNGPRAVLISRNIASGIPANLVVWVGASDAYAEVQFDDADPTTNQALLAALKQRSTDVELAFGEALDWRGLDASAQQVKRTKVVTPKVSIGSRVEPTEEGLQDLADLARRLLDAVNPYLSTVMDEVSATSDDDEPSSDTVEQRVDAVELDSSVA